ncbi:MAG TPA: CFI-box-CTERM domain-containing protein [Dehalococcoidia bacterium]|nr:CFI-box-CTERM domain-containing protein [Dehalococcoidia bacterium]
MKKEKKLLLFLALVLIGALLFSSVPASAGENPGRGKSLAEARKALEQELLPLAGAGFVGIAHSEDEGEVIVFVEDEQTKQRVPRSFEGYTVRTEVTGRVKTLSTQVAEPLNGVSPERQHEVRPLVGGTSLSAYVPDLYYSGTLGMVTYDDKILSNAHVIAMNPGTAEFLDIGTSVIQPGSGDGGNMGDRVGGLEDYIPIDFDTEAENYADAAIGSIDEGVDASYGEQFDEGGNYWVEGWTEVSPGDIVRKSGRTTGVTTGEVYQTNGSVWVEYGDQVAHFVDQIIVEQVNWSFSGHGDSGSAVDKDGEFVGLVFAGSQDYAFINKAEHIINELGIAVEPLENQYILTISSTPGGSVTTPGEGRFICNADEVVDLVAEPDPHYHFVEWTGDVDEIDNVYAASTTITMNGSYSITANFELDEGWYSLTISSTEGGEVTTPGEGTSVHAANTTVDLVAEPDEHYHFGNWTGDVSTIADVYAASTNITMYDSYSITANFELDEGWYSLTISSTEGGSVTTPSEGTSVHAANTTVDLVAAPDVGYQFLKWTGNVSTIADVNAAETTIAMNASYSITATFKTSHPEPIMVILTVSSTTGGSVTTPGEGTFSCPLGSEVNLVAEAVSGYRFTNWSGDVGTIADVNDATTTITMDSSYSIIANFSGAGSRCFIATAAYGTPMAGEIQILREFRDEYLLTNPAGQALVGLYYRVSPPMAEFITEHPSLKPIMRAGLLPAVAMSTIAVNTTPAEKTAIVSLLVLVSVALAVWAMKRRDKGPEYTRG